ncbi:MAG: DUF4358 domain-containing protein [Ruminococcaceae bacterium]|nr:DUF4358 domain-containing protein [Oscillospiraceae bacterium]
MKKILCFALALMLLALPLTACSKKYADDVSVKDLSNAVFEALSGELPDYSTAEKGYLDDYMTVPDYVTEYTIRFSTAGNNLDEFGIFHVTDGNAEDLETELEDYLEESYEQNKDWYDSYMPEETPKLRDAQVKVFGNYVVYVILSEADCEAAFEAVEKALKK